MKVSWNIDCLNDKNKLARVEEVCAILLEVEERRLPDVILLQVRSRSTTHETRRRGVACRGIAWCGTAPHRLCTSI